MFIYFYLVDVSMIVIISIMMFGWTSYSKYGLFLGYVTRFQSTYEKYFVRL